MTKKIFTNIKKMELILNQLEETIKIQKTAFQQTEIEINKFKKIAITFIENVKKQNEKKPRKPSGFALPVDISPVLCNFLNLPEGSQISRTDVTRILIRYITENNLIHPDKKTIIVPNEELKNLLGNNIDLDNLTRFTIQRYMNPHYISVIK